MDDDTKTKMVDLLPLVFFVGFSAVAFRAVFLRKRK